MEEDKTDLSEGPGEKHVTNETKSLSKYFKTAD